MYSVRIKICGVQDPFTAEAAALAGADAVGMVLAPGRRQVSPEQARAICQAMPPLVARVGVFVDAPADEVRQIACYCGFDLVQLHGRESPAYCRSLGLRCLKGVAARSRQALEQADNYPVAALLVDTYLPGRVGGTGQPFDWRLLENLPLKLPFILAGGLHPGNVGRAVALLRPYGVDVSSGVEVNGQKDLQLIKTFIKRAKEVSYHAAG